MVTLTCGILQCKLSEKDLLEILDNTAIENGAIDLLYRVLGTKRSPFSFAERIRFLETLKDADISNEVQKKIVEFILPKVQNV